MLDGEFWQENQLLVTFQTGNMRSLLLNQVSQDEFLEYASSRFGFISGIYSVVPLSQPAYEVLEPFYDRKGLVLHGEG